MAAQLAADATSAADHVEHPGWQVGFGHQLGELEAVDRGFLAGLDNDGVAGDQRRRQLAGNEEEREVPRQDAGHHPQGFTEQEDVLAGAVAGDDLAFDAPAPLGHVVQVVGGKVNFDFRQCRDLALLCGDGARQVRDIGADLRRDLAQVLPALVGRLARPVVLHTTGGGDGLVDVFLGRGRDVGQQRSGGRVAHRQVLGADAKSTGDVVLVDR